MLTRSKLRKSKLNNNTNSKSKMADNSDNNGGSEVEFDVNNQMGEKGWGEAMESESPEVSSEARGQRQHDEVRAETEQTQSQNETQQQTPTNIDIVAVLQQFTQRLEQRMTENTKQSEQRITENTNKNLSLIHICL